MYYTFRLQYHVPIEPRGGVYCARSFVERNLLFVMSWSPPCGVFVQPFGVCDERRIGKEVLQLYPLFVTSAAVPRAVANTHMKQDIHRFYCICESGLK